jgi:hypothetical protein
MRYLVLFLQGLFIVGVLGCCITIPLAAWGYFSVLFKKDSETERGENEVPTD